MKILLLEDDLILNEIIEEFLQSLNYEVVSSFDGEEACEAIYENIFDLLILDVNVPNINGFELLQQIRNQKIYTPAIFITSLNTLDDVQQGFAVGCDDYIKKPFELKELELRINNIKRHFNIVSTEQIVNEHLSFNLNENTIINHEIKTQLPQKEMKILYYFFTHKNKTITHEEITSNIWPYEQTPTNATLRTYIKNLRKILDDDSIETIKGVGYRFNA